MKKLIVFFLIFSFMIACKSTTEEPHLPGVTEKNFGTADGKEVKLFTLSNGKMEVDISNYGGIVTAIRMPDKNGKIDDIVLGFDSLSEYLAGHPYFGAIIGRYGNRIGNAQFSIDDRWYQLAKNNGPNSLHGGVKGFDKQVWLAKAGESNGDPSVILNYVSLDMEEGFPGTLSCEVVYILSANNELIIRYTADTDKATLCNLTNHSYFNLNGHASGNILSHQLMIHADSITPVDETLIPTGELMPVDAGPFDFRTLTAIGDRIDNEDMQLKHGGGYDHNWVLNRIGVGLEEVAVLYSSSSGRKLTVLTTEPGLQFYSGNFLDGSLTGKGGAVYKKRFGLCLETQHFPDSPNKPQFPTTRLDPAQGYSTETWYRFSVE